MKYIKRLFKPILCKLRRKRVKYWKVEHELNYIKNLKYMGIYIVDWIEKND